MTRRRITVVTAGHLATCPRMVKAADALHGAGYDVRVISTSGTPWAVAADRELKARRGWRWEVIAHDRASAPLRWLSSGLRHRAAEIIAHRALHSAPHRIVVAAFSRMHAELVRAILREPCDFVYGGTSGALAAVAEAARRSGTPFALDIEDLHCSEHADTARGALRDELAARVMRDAVREARLVTAGSEAIGRACEERFGIRPLTINNVFPLPDPPANDHDGGDLRLYWFSQTVGAGRGLEGVIAAAGRARLRAELHVRGMADGDYLTGLQAIAARIAPALRVVHHAPEHPDDLVAGCRAFDVGLAVEQRQPLNRALGLPNKALTYPLAGLAMVVTDTPGQRPLADDLGTDAIVYAPGEIERLADGLTRWAGDRRALARAKTASWEAARRRWHWEHPLERDQLLSAIEAAA
jgi:hypothetical protein